ncbi:MAG: hypothetical protein QM702_03665 [Rubrivivax sp.]
MPTYADPLHPALVRVTRVKSNGLVADETFGGGDGRVDIKLADEIGEGESLKFGDTSIDDLGRIYLTFTQKDKQNDGRLHLIARVVRLNAIGTIDTTYGVNGFATVYDVVADAPGTNVDRRVADRTFDPEARFAYTLASTRTLQDDGPDTVTLRLYRTDQNGTTTSVAVGRELGTDGHLILTGQVSIGPDHTRLRRHEVRRFGHADVPLHGRDAREAEQLVRLR